MATKQGSPATIAVWKAVKAAGAPMTAVEIQAATGLPVTTVHRSSTALANAGLLTRGVCRNEHDQRVTSFVAAGALDRVTALFGPKPLKNPRRSIAPMRIDPTAMSYFGAGVPRVASVWALAAL